MRIALLEKNPADVRWFRLMVTDMRVPHEIVAFYREIDALAYFRRNHPPDLVVSDWKLPVLEFEDFVHRVREIPRYESTPLAVLTGIADNVRQQVLSQGAMCCIQKPLDTSALWAIFSEIAASANTATIAVE